MAGQVTQLLIGVRAGDRAALDRLFALVYDELRNRAHWQLSQSPGPQTLGTTALVHEAYLKLSSAEDPSWQDRRHFYRVAARAMRQIVIDQARRRLAAKRGGDAARVDIADVEIGVDGRAEQLVALDAALDRLQSCSERLAEVVELRFYSGLSVEDTARALDVSDRTVKRDWRIARAFLYRELGQSGGLDDLDEAD